MAKLFLNNEPKFKIGDKVVYSSIAGWPFAISESDLKPHAVTDEEQLVRDLEICGGNNNCAGCSRDNPDGTGTGCDKLELDAAELIKKLQKRVKELEEKK